MPFEVETLPRVHNMDLAGALLDSIRDSLPETATQAELDDKLVQAIVGIMRGYKSANGLRAGFAKHWKLIAPLIDREPDQFDALILEFMECRDRLS